MSTQTIANKDNKELISWMIVNASSGLWSFKKRAMNTAKLTIPNEDTESFSEFLAIVAKEASEPLKNKKVYNSVEEALAAQD